MFHDTLLIIVSLLFTVSMLAMLSDKLRISYPILLVIAGLIIGFIPGIPVIRLDPDMVFLIFLPPLLYAAAWNTSWRNFWRLKRPISMLAFGLVIFTATAIAFTANALIPGFTLAMGFLLGGIISPPDTVAATSVLQNLKVPKRVVTILEGESLINDASSLIVFRFALAAILTGNFVLMDATTNFFVVAFMGVVVGLAVAHIAYVIHRFLPTTASIDAAFTLISPYLMYVAAEHYHFSGVLAVVSGGLFLSFRSHDIFSYETRLQTYSVWNTLIFILNGFVFILIGLQLPHIVDGLGSVSLLDSILYGLIISLLTIVVRIIWVFPGAYIPRWISKKIRTREDNPGWKNVLLVAWSGMRGVVSLASALAIPLTITNGEAFPQRNLILFITFIVILVTLVFQGLSLPFLIKWLDIQVHENEEEQEQDIRLRLASTVVEYLDANYNSESSEIEAFNRVKERYKRMIEFSGNKLASEENASKPAFMPKYRQMLIELVDVRRKTLVQMRKEKKYDDELLRKKENELDLEEARLRK